MCQPIRCKGREDEHYFYKNYITWRLLFTVIQIDSVWLSGAFDLCVLPKNPQLQSNHETSISHSEVFYKYLPGLLKTIKVIKKKKRQRSCHRPEETGETGEPNATWHPGGTLEQKETMGKGLNWNEAWSLVNNHVPMFVLTNVNVNNWENWVRGVRDLSVLFSWLICTSKITPKQDVF